MTLSFKLNWMKKTRRKNAAVEIIKRDGDKTRIQLYSMPPSSIERGQKIAGTVSVTLPGEFLHTNKWNHETHIHNQSATRRLPQPLNKCAVVLCHFTCQGNNMRKCRFCRGFSDVFVVFFFSFSLPLLWCAFCTPARTKQQIDNAHSSYVIIY